MLIVPLLFGLLAGRIGVFNQPRGAVERLNWLAINFAFPALVAAGVANQKSDLPSDPAFWLLWPCSLALMLLGVRLFARDKATMGLVSTFGNVAYLGLPVTFAVYGSEAMGPASLIVSVHVVLAVTVGPAVATYWGEGRADGGVVKVLKMPLFWAPFFGAGIRFLPAGAEQAATTLGYLGMVASPIALFMLGLYVFIERKRAMRPDVAVFKHAAQKLFVVPAVIAAACFAAVGLGWLEPQHARYHMLLGAMPAAITAFSIALDAKIDAEVIGSTIIWSTAISVVTIPLWWLLSSIV